MTEKIPMYDDNGKLNIIEREKINIPAPAGRVGMLTEKELQRFRERKKGLDCLMIRGFKWPSAFKCGNLERNIGTIGLEEIQKLAWLRYNSGWIPDEFIIIIDGKRTIIPEKREELDKYLDDNLVPVCLSPDGSRYFDMCLTALRDSCYQSTIKQLEPLAEIGKEVKDGGKDGADKANKEKQECYPRMKTAADKIAKEHPTFSISQAAEKLSTMFPVCTKTIKERCKTELAVLNKKSKK